MFVIFDILTISYFQYFGSAGRAEPFKSAAPVSQSGVPRRVKSSLVFLQTPDPQTDPALPADRASEIAFCRPSGPKTQIFGRLFADRKFIENPTPLKPTQNLKNRALERPNLDFGVTFGVHFGIDFYEFSTFSKNCESLNNIVKLQ